MDTVKTENTESTGWFKTLLHLGRVITLLVMPLVVGYNAAAIAITIARSSGLEFDVSKNIALTAGIIFGVLTVMALLKVYPKSRFSPTPDGFFSDDTNPTSGSSMCGGLDSQGFMRHENTLHYGLSK